MKTIRHYEGYHDPNYHTQFDVAIAESALKKEKRSHEETIQKLAVEKYEHKALKELQKLDRFNYYETIKELENVKNLLNSRHLDEYSKQMELNNQICNINVER